MDVTRSCYSAPCQWYRNGPIGKIRWYFAKEGAQVLDIPTVFWPYSQHLEMGNSTGAGEIVGPGLRKYDKGINRNDLPGTHHEGTEADFVGDGINPATLDGTI